MTVTPSNPVPFLVGFVLAVVYAAYIVIELVWKARNNVRAPWEYDSDVRQACAYFMESYSTFNWRVIVGGPFVVGGVTYLAWWLIYLLAGWMA